MTRNYHWYVLYTRSNHETAAESHLTRCGIQSFLPRQSVLHRWSDRKKWIDEPLFPSYIFAKLSIKEYEKALQHSSISFCIKCGGFPSCIPDEQIQAIKTILENNVCFEVSNEQFEPGDLVEIDSGPLIGIKAEVVQSKGRENLILRIACVNKNIVLITSCMHIRILDQNLVAG